MLITDDVRLIIERAKLAFVATTSADGSPNLSPKGSLRVYDDDHLIFMDIASPNTIANLHRDPRLEICVVDFFRRRGYRLKGNATLVAPDRDAYRWLNEWLLEVNGPGYPANEAVLVTVNSVVPVVSPAYTWGHATESELEPAWRQRYNDASPCSGVGER
jgi:predicted pyridoxine 5'-phosphate oxidase superfamily flavin-nucleotide-binding protein